MATSSQTKAEKRSREKHVKPMHTVTIQGKLLRYEVKRYRDVKPPKEKRKEISEFSNAARLRLLKFVARVDWSKVERGCLLTLTYPDEKTDRTKEQLRKDKYLILRHMENYLNERVCGVWRLEWEPRKSGVNKGKLACHWHFLILRLGYIPYAYVREKWKQVLNHVGGVRVHFRHAWSGELAGLYIAKYVAKRNPVNNLVNVTYRNKVGRHYGYMRKADMALCPETRIENLTYDELRYLVTSGMEKLPWVRAGDNQGFSLLGNFAADVGKNLEEMRLTSGGDVVYNP